MDAEGFPIYKCSLPGCEAEFGGANGKVTWTAHMKHLVCTI